jgi:cation-transporting P-type ATPase E
MSAVVDSESDHHDASRASGLTEQQAADLLACAPRRRAPSTSRSYRSIVRANVVTVFNVILAAFGLLTLIFGDWRDALFLGIIVTNASIGIIQEVRAKHALDRLALLIAPRARVIREGATRAIAVEQVVVGDLLELGPGDQIVADGELVRANDLRVDEAVLSGESEPVDKEPGAQLRSGTFVVEGTGSYIVRAVGQDAFAARIVGEARSFRHPRSPLERAVNRLLYALVVLVLGLGSLLGYSLHHRHAPLHEAVATASAGVVSLIPEGLMVLVSLTYAVAAIRMSRRGVLAQQLNAIESLACVEVLCVDKTGTLTESALRVVELIPADGVSDADMQSALARLAASSSSPNGTLKAIAEAYPGEPDNPVHEVPFSSRRRWSGLQFAEHSYLLGAPERLAAGELSAATTTRQRRGRRVLALARSASLPTGDDPPEDAQLMGLIVLAERLRPHIRQTVEFLLSQGVELKVLSGDAAQTVAAIARDVGIPVSAINDGEQIPKDPIQLRQFAATATVLGRVCPEDKRSIVEALRASGRYVAMVGDGVNDVPALKAARLAVAQGSGTQMARSVADLVLLDGDFAVVPKLIGEGRRALRNLQRVAKLYVTKSAFAAFLILTIGTTSDAYPLLPRHLTLTASITIGIPTFFLALAPSSGPWRPTRFVRNVARFALPSGVIAGAGLVAGYLFALHDLDYSIARSRTIAATILVCAGLYLVLALETAGSRRRSAFVGTMCAGLAGLYVTVLLLPATRHFFKLTSPTAGMILTALIAALLAIGALWLAGYTLLFGDHSESVSQAGLTEP